MNQPNFALKTIVMSTLMVLYSSPSLAEPYVQGKGDVATIDLGETVRQIDTVSSTIPDPVTGTLNRSGIPVRIIWYGHPGDNDGEIPQTGANNKGIIDGKVIAVGTLTEDSEKYEANEQKQGNVVIETQGNAIDAFGWVARKNTRDIDFTLNNITNSRTITAEADLTGGAGEVHGSVTSFASANGIAVAGTAEFGKAIGGIGGVDGVSGASGSVKAKRRSSRSRVAKPKPASSSVNTKNTARKSSHPTVSDTDLHGKNISIALQQIDNSDKISGKLKAIAATATPDMSEYNPQFYAVAGLASGNGVSLTTFIDTPDSYTFSDDKKNTAALGTVTNSGTIEGDALLKGGIDASHTQTKSQGSGNGISVYTATGRRAANKTVGTIDAIENNGNITGHLQQISGDNSGYESIHMLSVAKSIGSGNGISNYSESYHGQTKKTEALIGDINNTGKISGDSYLQAGDGSGDLSVKAQNIGNGVSTYVDVGGTGTRKTEIGNVNNKGMITGNVETRAGVTYGSAKKGQVIPDEELKLVITTSKNYSSFKR